MKKITLLMMATIMLVAYSFAQTPVFSEDFDGATALPTGWETYDETGFTPDPGTGITTAEWVTRDDAVAAVSWFAPVGQADSWLVTPQISINSDQLELSWKAQSIDSDFPEAYEVYISTTGNEVSDFTGAPVYSNNAEESDLTTRTVNLAAFDGEDIYIAFRIVSNDAFILSIDDVTVGEPLPPEPFLQSIVSFTPNVGIYHEAGAGGGDFSALYPAALDVVVVNHSDRTNFSADVTISNDGTETLDTVYIGFFIVEVNTNEFIEFVDTVELQTPLDSGDVYTHTFSSDLTADFQTYSASNGALLAGVFIPESEINVVEDDADFLLFSAVEPYTAGFSSSFEATQGQNLSFFNDTYTWKQFNNAGAQSWIFRTFSDVQAFDGSGILLAGPGATDDIIQSPEFSFETGVTYQVSVRARTGFGNTGSSAIRLIDSNGVVENLGGMSLAVGDTVDYTKFTYDFTVPANQEDYMFEFSKTNSSLIILDLFEVIELVPPTVSLSSLSNLSPGNGVEYCDSTVTLNYTTSGPADSLVVDWGDGNTSFIEFPNANGSISHQYTSFGNFDISAEVGNAVGTASSANNLSVEIAATPAAEADFVIASNAAGVVTIINNSTPNCPGVSYIWDFGDNTVEQGNVTSHTYTENGTYTIQLTVNNGQGSVNQFSREVTITGIQTSISDIDFNGAMSVYPSPTNSLVNVAFQLKNTQNVDVAIYSVDGKVVDVQNYSNTTDVNTQFNVSSLTSGVYFIKVTTDEGIATQKFVVSHN